MKNVIVLLLLAFGVNGYGQIITFPDPNFKNALVNTKCVDTDMDFVGDIDADLNNDGEIDVSEAKLVKNLDIRNGAIKNIEEINNFTELERLNCSGNQLSKLNLENVIKLYFLDCSYNQLPKLEIQKLSGLNYLNCEANQLTSLTLNNLFDLQSLYCGGNQFTQLDLQYLFHIQVLDCSNNQLQELSFNNNNMYLLELNCSGNKIKQLDLKYVNNLYILYCSDNQLLQLDLQNLTKLIYFECSVNQLSQLNLKELYKLSTLDCSSNKLKTLDVQNLKDLNHLSCSSNQLSKLDLQNQDKLISLKCSSNQLTHLDLQNLNNLKTLECSSNQLSQLDINNLNLLTYLDCSDNLLTELNVKNLTLLLKLLCSNNQLTKLEVKNLTKLRWLTSGNNLLTQLDVNNLTLLSYLECSNNQLTQLDVKNITSLSSLFCSNNQLMELDVQNLNNLSHFNCDSNQLRYLLLKGPRYYFTVLKFQNNSTLKYICCSDNQLQLIQNKLQEYGYTNCEVNSYCSFTTVGKSYTILGNNTFDGNINGCDDQDIKLQYYKYKITDGSFSGSLISNSTGNYQISVQTGTHTITPIFENPDYFEVTPSSITVTFPSTSDTITQNFCIIPKGTFRQTNITVIPLSPPARPGFDASYKIVWENVGNQIESGTLNFTYDETLLDYISATQTADQVAAGIVKWNFNNLLPFEKREITVTLKVNRPTDTPAVNAGDKLYLTASILDNIFTLENTVVGSYDPNDKTCLQGDRVKPDMVGKYVDYLIRFENTGNYAAENVVVKDIIDTKRFNVSTLQITDASHEVYTRIEGNKVEFIFENIQLPFDDANNDGYIAFKIKTLRTLVLGDSLKNLADIYFDYNFPIRTNEAQTTIALPSFIQDIITDVNIYPNPVRDILYLESDENWNKAEIYDIAGRILRSISLESKSLDVSGLESGTYLVRLKDGEKIGMFKFVKI